MSTSTPKVPKPKKAQKAPPSDRDAPKVNMDRLPEGMVTYPLHPVDPPKIGDFWPSARLVASTAGVAYLAYEEHATAPVMVIMLSQGASEDPAARDRLAGEVDRMDIDTVIARGGLGQDSGRMGDKFRSEHEDPQGVDSMPQSPWVALAFDQSSRAIREAKRILARVDLSAYPPQGESSGPDYRLHWSDRFGPGLTRVWPLPWPGRRDRSGRLTLVAAWLLMLLLAAVAILIAILIFSQAPETPPPPPIPTQNTDDSSAGGSPPPTTPSESSEGQSSPQESDTAESSPSPGDEDTGGGSPSPGEEQSGGGSPTPGDETTGPGGGPSTPSRM
ncbi:MAG: hypothetical protein LBG99_00780 [Propionibacteriaceae bacterium]|nr:hypothetical protein [Propionibacteriaceae bacterium]